MNLIQAHLASYNFCLYTHLNLLDDLAQLAPHGNIMFTTGMREPLQLDPRSEDINMGATCSHVMH
jgi:hypothetical protein